MFGANRDCSSCDTGRAGSPASSSMAATTGRTSYARRREAGSRPAGSCGPIVAGGAKSPGRASRATRRPAWASASLSDSASTCATPERWPCTSGPPSDQPSTCSPVTAATTSGPVTKIRPAGAITTMSVSAGPYAAPPAAGPSTTEICGTRPDAATIAANTRPTPSSDSTPSASLAPPECQSPTTGQPHSTAVRIAATMCRHPTTPIAPPITPLSVAYPTTRVPPLRPTTAWTPESSRACRRLHVPASRKSASFDSELGRVRSTDRTGTSVVVI